MTATQAPRRGGKISIPLSHEWADQQAALAAFRAQRQMLHNNLMTLSTAPDDALLQSIKALLAAPARRIPLLPEETAQGETARQALRRAATAKDSAAYGRALAAVLLYLTPPQLDSLQPTLLQPWLAGILATALNDYALISVGDDQATTQQAMQWCLAFAHDLQSAHLSGTLPGGAEAWRKQWLPLLGFDITAINFYSTPFNLRDFVAHFGAFRAEAFAAHPAVADGANLRILGSIPDRPVPDKRHRLALFCSHPTAHGHGLPHILWWLTCLDRNKFEPILVLRQLPENTVLIERLLQRYPQLTDFAPIIIAHDANLAQLAAFDFDLLYNFDDICRGRSERPGYTRLAKQQVTAFYTPATTGATAMDFFITSNALDPTPADAFTEQVVLTDGLPFCFHYESYFGVTPHWAQRDRDIPADAIIYTMGSSMLTKVRPEFIDALLAIMQQVPNSYCVAMPSSRPKDRLHLTEMIIRKCAMAGVAPERIRFYPVTSRGLLHGLLSISDVFLDFFPFSGTNNLMDPLATATPCVTLCPNPGYSRNRIGGTILRQLGLGELVVETVEDYVKLAVLLGKDAARRQALRQRMGRAVLEDGPLCDGPAFVARMEAAFATMLAASAAKKEARYA